MPPDPASDALDALFWRDEILQVLFWMQGEGLADAVNADDLCVFLRADAATLTSHLDGMASEGLLARKAPGTTGTSRYTLTDAGRQEAGRRFADAFDGLQRQGHGECSADCVCQWEGPAACPAHGHPHPHA